MALLRSGCSGLPNDDYIAVLSENVWCAAILEWLGETSAHTQTNTPKHGDAARDVAWQREACTSLITLYFTPIVSHLN
jgi:hypothetical protein